MAKKVTSQIEISPRFGKIQARHVIPAVRIYCHRSSRGVDSGSNSLMHNCTLYTLYTPQAVQLGGKVNLGVVTRERRHLATAMVRDIVSHLPCLRDNTRYTVQLLQQMSICDIPLILKQSKLSH